MTQKQWMMVAGGVALVLLVGAIFLYFMTGDVTVAGSAGAAATAAAGEAMRRRQLARAEVEEAKERTKIGAERVGAIKDKADVDMDAVADDVAAKSDDEKVAEGNDLFS